MIYQIIEELRSDNSRLFKERVLEKHKDNQLLKKVLHYTLSPRKQYYIKKIPKYVSNPNYLDPAIAYEMIFAFLDKAHNRLISGNDAIDALWMVLSHIQARDAKVLELIIQRDLKCNTGTTSINKIFPNLIEDTPYMRVSLLKDMKRDKIDWTKGLISQEKLDGMFANISVGSKKEVLSRSGSSFPTELFSNIIGNLEKHLHEDSKDLVFHGELVVYQSNELLKREIGNGILNSLLKTGEFDTSQYEISFIVWDVITHDEFYNLKKSDVPYNVRFNTLENLFNIDGFPVVLCPTRIVYSFEEAKAHYKQLALEGKEGTILKLQNSTWKDSTSREMWKFKVEAEAELRVYGFTEGNGKNKELFGSILMKSEDELLEVCVSGFSDDERKEITANMDSYMACIGSVVYNSVMKPEGKKASMFLPRFKEWRLDKTQANTLKEIEDIFESVLNDVS